MSLSSLSDSADLPDKLLTELTAYHSLGLRNALAAAVLNALVLDLFYREATMNQQSNRITIEGAIEMNLASLSKILAEAASMAEAAYSAMQAGNRNGAIGTVLELPEKLKACSALLEVSLAMHRGLPR